MADECQRCGEPHTIFRCPHVKAIEMDGEKITRVEFLLPIDFPPARPEPPPEVDYPRLGAKPHGPNN